MNRTLAALLAAALPLSAAGGQMPAPVLTAKTDAALVPPEVAPVPVALLVDTGSGQVLYAKEPTDGSFRRRSPRS